MQSQSRSRVHSLALCAPFLLALPLVQAQDCNSNGVDDSLDISNGTSDDCNQNGTPDECELDSVELLFADFDGSALPPGVELTMNGIWHVGTACRPAGDCGADNFAYFGVDATCTFSTGNPEQGNLAFTGIELPANSSPELTFCSYYGGEGGDFFDETDLATVWVRETGTLDFEFLEFTSGTDNPETWETRTLDLSAFAGLTVDLEFIYSTDDKLFNSFFGWGLDNVRITHLGDLNDNQVLDCCECTVNYYCAAAPNSVGSGATIDVEGSVMIGNNDFVLTTTGLPVNDFGIYYYGPNATQVPFGDGFRCIDPPNLRLPVISTGNGVASFAFDYTSIVHNPGNHVFAGATHNFQFWYRDHVPGGANFNLSDAVEILFCP